MTRMKKDKLKLFAALATSSLVLGSFATLGAQGDVAAAEVQLEEGPGAVELEMASDLPGDLEIDQAADRGKRAKNKKHDKDNGNGDDHDDNGNGSCDQTADSDEAGCGCPTGPRQRKSGGTSYDNWGR